MRAAAIGLLLAAACASGVSPVREGAPAPDLVVRTTQGDALRLDSLGRPAVIFFYARDDTPG